MPSIPASSSSPPPSASSSLINKSVGDLSAVDLICADMDGTLLSPDHSIPDITFNRINKADNNGCPVLPATGRCRASTSRLFEPAGIDLYSRPGIYLNGSVTYDHTGAVAAEKSHKITDVLDAVSLLRDDNSAVLLCYSGDRVLAPYRDDRVIEVFQKFGDPIPEDCGSYDAMLEKISAEKLPVHVMHVMSFEDPIAAGMCEKLDDFAKSKGCVAAQSVSMAVDIVPQGVSKGYGVKVLKEKLGYNCVACIGDAMNDYGMLLEADVPVAMGNALPQLKSVASIEVNTNADKNLPGVADLIDRVCAARKSV
ncbi:hypothetical protein FOZ62_012948 [Perkinsus olseni]|uniref:Uncharacterized protein n=1 Tax=Perkinsus olseni TaxID=32597 RepID=A0A7J6R9U9_PEROL|nr:hypothetical protein FOZ62_012948 [Perkinsus olseni]